MFKKRGQVWVETVIYTLIGIAVLGVVLGIVKPKIEETRDKLVIDKAIEMLENLNRQVYDVKQAVGNSRTVDLKLNSGKIVFDSPNDKIVFNLEETRIEYSEPGTPIQYGSALEIITVKNGNRYDVSIALDYKDKFDLKYTNENIEKTLNKASKPYTLLVSNTDTTDAGKPIINIETRG